MTKIGEDVSKRHDVIPAQWRVLVTRRSNCRRCTGSVVQAHALVHVVRGGLPTEAAIAQVIVSKFGDHTPFYPQAEIYARQGIRRHWATGPVAPALHLQPVADHMRRHLAAADRVFMNETTAPVLDPGWGQTKKPSSGRSSQTIGAIAAQVRRSCRSDMHPVAAAPSLSSSTASTDPSCNAMPMTVTIGLIEVARPQGPSTLVHCWSHLRRRFVKLVRHSKSPVAEAGVRQIAQLYTIEAMVRGSLPDIRLVARKENSLPLFQALQPWFEKQLSMISSDSTLAEDIRYALNH